MTFTLHTFRLNAYHGSLGLRRCSWFPRRCCWHENLTLGVVLLALARYLDLLARSLVEPSVGECMRVHCVSNAQDKTQAFYLVFFKITCPLSHARRLPCASAVGRYIVTSIIVLAVFYKLDSTYERQKDHVAPSKLPSLPRLLHMRAGTAFTGTAMHGEQDTCSLAAILVPCSISAVLLAETCPWECCASGSQNTQITICFFGGPSKNLSSAELLTGIKLLTSCGPSRSFARASPWCLPL